MSTIAKRIYARDSFDNIAIDAVVNPMQAQLVSEVKPALTMLLGAVIFVLLIAIGNIANLMLTRATARRREIGIRISLGASDWAIIKQLIVEGLVLSFTGAVVGVALAYLLMPALLHAAGGVLPPGADVRIDAADADVIRNVGTAATDDVVRSLMFSIHVLGVRDIMIVGHTGCGMEMFSEEEFEKHLHKQTGVWAVSPDKFHCYSDVNLQTQKQVLKLRSHPWIPSDIVIRGFVVDLATGELREVTPKGDK
jgi:carbonic anhydrase